MVARTGLEVVPRLAAELRKRWWARIGADVAGDLADLLVRDVQAILAAEGDEQVVAGDPGDLLRLEAEQLADAVVKAGVKSVTNLVADESHFDTQRDAPGWGSATSVPFHSSDGFGVNSDRTTPSGPAAWASHCGVPPSR